jgi:hypothetical protein
MEKRGGVVSNDPPPLSVVNVIRTRRDKRFVFC